VGTDEIVYADVVVVQLSGRIDQERSPAVQAELHARFERLETSGTVGAALDLSSVPYMSSAGLRVLMIAAKEARAHGLTLAVFGLRPVVREVFQISRFDKVIPIYEQLSEALAALSAAAATAYASRDSAQ